MCDNNELQSYFKNLEKEDLINIINTYLCDLNDNNHKNINDDYDLISKNIKLTLSNKLKLLIIKQSAMFLDGGINKKSESVLNKEQFTITDGFEKINKQLSEYDNVISDLKVISNFFKNPFNYHIEPTGKDDFELSDNSGAERDIVEVLLNLANKLEEKNDTLRKIIIDINRYIK